MKTVNLLFGFVITILLMTNCNRPTVLDEKDTETFKTIEYGRTIPVDIRFEDNKKALVSFIFSAQIYTLDFSENDRTNEIELLKNAITNETPLKIFLKENTTEIVKVKPLEAEEQHYLKSILVAPSQDIHARSTAAVSVIPNQSTLTNLFNIVKNQSCGSAGTSIPCITFRYAVDGCYARAHKVRQILANNGYDCQKQFVYGDLRASNGYCCVNWGYHVAVLVQFRNANGVIEDRIFDLSLFPNAPVLPLTWRNACINSTCGATYISSYVNTAGNVYYRNPTTGSVVYDNNYTHTNCVLDKFKLLSGCTPSPAPSTSDCY